MVHFALSDYLNWKYDMVFSNKKELTNRIVYYNIKSISPTAQLKLIRIVVFFIECLSMMIFRALDYSFL
jgi:hypothetical protein